MWERVGTVLSEQTLLAVLVAFAAGVALGRFWIWIGRARGAASDPRRAASIHYILGLDFLASRQIDRAVAELTKAARENTEATEIFLILGNLLREKGQLERAIQIHQSVLHRPGLPKDERAHALLCLGMDFKKAGFRYRAMDTFREVIALEPANAYALTNLVKIHEEEQDWEKALSLQEELARVTGSPDSTLRAFLYDQIGQAGWRAGEEPRAVRAFEESIRTEPSVPAAYLHYGDMLESHGRLEEAETQWSRIAKESPRNAHLAFERLERVRAKLAKSERMEKLYQEVAREDERDWRARLALSRLRRSQNRADEAYELLLEAVRRNPHALAVHIEVWSFLGTDGGPSGARLARYLDEVSKAVFLLDPYICIKCNYRANGILWRCPHCQDWNTFVEERLETVDSESDSER
ncbi:MAG: tetratricopeptide repeat protein [Vicinamibacteria bacterium]